MKISSKPEFYRLWIAGALGNTTQVWDGKDAHLRAAASTISDVGFREVGKGGGGKFEIVPRAEILSTASAWRAAGRQFSLSEAAPDDFATIRGEICQTIRGWEGQISVGRGRMREAMKIAKPFRGIAVVAILNHYMDPSSRDTVDGLFELYPEATIEFACYSKDVGVIPNRNTIIWEVRDY